MRPQALLLPQVWPHHAGISVAGLEASVAYSVTGIEGVAAHLREAGADFVWDVRVHGDVKVLFLRDNTGNFVELVEPLEPADDERTLRP